MNRVLGGKKAKSHGRAFEQAIDDEAKREGLVSIWWPDGCETIARPPYLIRTKVPFDFTILKDSKGLFLDAKSLDKKSIGFADMKEHQVLKLYEIQQSGFAAGYLVYFRPSDHIVFFKAGLLMSLYLSGGHLDQEEGTFCGNIHNFRIDKLL